jgi:endonuclease YncB( thermonuclease family)
MPAAAALLICVVVGISDGDTLTARCEVGRGLKTFKVRLREIDAPEREQPYGSRSKQNLSSICFKRPALLQAQGTDSYGRLLARVECDGVDANASQVAMGMAWVYDQYVTDETLYEYQGEAQAQRRGLWARRNPVAPWVWRRGSRSW